jgi:RNA polymerase sigma-B factor
MTVPMGPTVSNPKGSRATEKELWTRLARQRDPAAREELIRTYLPVAERLARRYAGVSQSFDDLFQVASLGLMNAVDRFDPALGTPFVGYAKPTILGEIKRYFRDKAWAVRVPRGLHDLIAKAEKTAEDLTLQLGRPPSVPELARHLGVEPSEVLETLEARENRRPLSLDAPATNDSGDDSYAPEWSGGEDPGYDLAEERMMLAGVLPGLEPRQRLILKLRFVDEMTQSQIAERLGCSQMHVSRLLRGTLARLREAGRKAEEE